MDKRKVIVLTALEFEARALRGTLAGVEGVEVCRVGLRAGGLPADLSAARCVVMAGLAGALDPSLRVGDLVLDSPVDVACDGVARRGLIHTTQCLVTTAAEKAELFRKTGALAVDMEQAIVRGALGGGGVPVIGLRAISDPADVAVDPAILRFVDERGSTRTLAVAVAILKRPALIGPLKKLGAASKIASKALAEGVRWLIEEGLRST
jgi:adenosylhomocysteine nucleosidase